MDFSLMTAIFGVFAAGAGFYAARFQLKSSQFDARLRIADEQLRSEKQKYDFLLNQAQQFVRNTVYSQHVPGDIIILGPRTAGKTSLVKYWVEFWKAHLSTVPTPRFDKYNFIFPKYRLSKGADNVFEIPIDTHIHAQLNIYDYGGEAHLVEEAISRIEDLNNCTIVFVMSAEPEYIHRNNEYYSTHFVMQMDELVASKKKLQRVIIVFSKIDLISHEKRNNNYLCSQYEDCVHKIKKVFGDHVKVFSLTVKSGEGVIPFLQYISSIYVDKDGLPNFTVKDDN